MKVAGEFWVDGSPADVWALVMEPEQLCRTLPGCRDARRIDDRHYEAQIAVRVQIMTIRARVRGELLEVDEPRHVVVEMVGDALGMQGAFHSLATLDFAARDGGTQVTYLFDIRLFGRLAALGEPLLRPTAEKLARQFGGNVSGLFDEEDRRAVPTSA